MSKAKSVVKTFNKQPRPSNDIQISGWPLSATACNAHMQVEGREGNGAGHLRRKIPQIFFTEAPSHHICPLYSPCGCQEGMD